MTLSPLRLGARGSPLSRVQTERVGSMIAATTGRGVNFDWITTSGDTIQDRALIEAGGKGLFTKELDEALLSGRIDLAVHSLKDLPTTLPPGVVLACVPEREDPRDAFVSLSATTLADLPAGAMVGTASLRRQAQTLHARPDLRVSVLRGNVDTRLRKLRAGEADATYLALAGLKRLGLQAHAKSLIDPNETPPACCQGALAITARSDDTQTLSALAALENADARTEIEAERAFLAALDGSCRTAIGALARCDGGTLRFIGEAFSADARTRWRRSATISVSRDPVSTAFALGERLGAEIRHEAGAQFIRDQS
jgi:hydroxymethylbilane synthase